MPMMTAHIRFEISLTLLDDRRYAVRASVQAAAHGVDAHPLQKTPVITFDSEALLAALLDVDRYSQLLTDTLFADPALVTAFEVARGQAELLTIPLRLIVRLSEQVGLAHEVRWETLRDPSRGGFLALNERIWLSRRVDSPELSPLVPAAPTDPVLIAVASPANLATFGLQAIDRVRYGAQFARVFGPGRIIALPQANEPVTVQRILSSIGEGVLIACLMCHGSIVSGESVFWLEDEQGNADRVSGDYLAQQIGTLARRPALVILVICHSATTGAGQIVPSAGVSLVRAGIPAVLAMQDKVHTYTVDRMLPVFMSELRRDGCVDRALAVARRAVADRYDWSVPALFLRGRSSELWQPEARPADTSAASAPREQIWQISRGQLNYGDGLRRLRELLADQAEQLPLLATLEARLLENLRDERMFGGNETLRSGRAQIIHALNTLALEACHVTFNELCSPESRR
jgi:hypothetical protein